MEIIVRNIFFSFYLKLIFFNFMMQEKLLKPLGSIPHLTGEWRDLAAVVSKVRFLIQISSCSFMLSTL